MSRPPIIISNGGVISELAKDIDDTDAFQKIKDNMDRINESEMTDGMVIVKGGKESPCIYWRLKGEAVFEDRFAKEIARDPDKKGREGISIIELIDPEEDLIE